MTVDIIRAQVLLRAGQTPGAVADQLGVTLRAVQRAFGRAGLTSPRAWQLAEVGSQANGGSPLVFFRLHEFAALEAAALEAGQRPNEFARTVVQAHLRASG